MIARYSRPELAALWDDAYRFEQWLAIELAVCEAMEQAGTVPTGTATKVREAAQGKLNPARILEIEQKTRHDVIAFLTHVEELAGEPARWLHLGMTSSDVLDTSLALQTGRASPVRFSDRIGFFLCGIAEEPFWPAPKPSSASPTSVRCQWRTPSAICSIAVPSIASALNTSA